MFSFEVDRLCYFSINAVIEKSVAVSVDHSNLRFNIDAQVKTKIN